MALLALQVALLPLLARHAALLVRPVQLTRLVQLAWCYNWNPASRQL